MVSDPGAGEMHDRVDAVERVRVDAALRRRPSLICGKVRPWLDR
jgi:hypothetical protein